MRLWSLAIGAAVAIPLGVVVYVMTPPLSEVRLDDAVQHFAVTTNVSLLAAAVSIAVMRPALDMRDWPRVLLALGFMTLGGFFVIHGLATPGVLLRGGSHEIAAVSVIALAGQLAMTVPALIFASRYTPLVERLRRSSVVTPRRLVAAMAAAIALFGLDVLIQPAAMSDMVEPVTGYGAAGSYAITSGSLQADPRYVAAVTALTILPLAFAAVRQSREFLRSRLPSHGALVIAFVLLAHAQVSAVLGPPYSLLFWNYHTLLALATVVALVALFVELDRRRGLERFLPATVVERVVTGDHLSLEGERRTVTILFTDLRGSTALAEHASPEATVSTVNAYLRAMARAVLDEGGILDKFTGDGLMAIFGAMSDTRSGAEAAARAALRMRRDITAINEERERKGEPTIGYGVGINTGDVVLGAIGLPERSDYTAMGDTVNTAARMESLTKELRADVVLSEATERALGGSVALRSLGAASVKGRSAPIRVFSLA